MPFVRIALAMCNQNDAEALTAALRIQSDFIIVTAVPGVKELANFLSLCIERIDVIVVDAMLPRVGEQTATKYMQRRYPHLAVVCVNVYAEPLSVTQMLSDGVKGFVDSPREIDLLIKSIRLASEGGVFLSERAAAIIQQHLIRTYSNPSRLELTTFEISLIKGIVTGASSTELGNLLHRSPRTIEQHREKLYRKFQVRTKAQLILKVVALGLI